MRRPREWSPALARHHAVQEAGMWVDCSLELSVEQAILNSTSRVIVAVREVWRLAQDGRNHDQSEVRQRRFALRKPQSGSPRWISL